jgi:hypothetical protein
MASYGTEEITILRCQAEPCAAWPFLAWAVYPMMHQIANINWANVESFVWTMEGAAEWRYNKV